MRALGIKTRMGVAQWPGNMKAAQAGALQMWTLGAYYSAPDFGQAFDRFESRQIGGQNLARVSLPELDVFVDKINALADGPERSAARDEAVRMAIAYMPYKHTVNPQSLDLAPHRVAGYGRPVFWLNWWEQVDIESPAP